jgi:hypothetical protein
VKDNAESVFEAKRVCGICRRNFSQAMSNHRIGPDAPVAEERNETRLNCKNRRLRDLRLIQPGLRVAYKQFIQQ